MGKMALMPQGICIEISRCFVPPLVVMTMPIEDDHVFL
jgi:hypothetical protein